MFAEIFLSLIISATLTVAGSFWIDNLYRNSDELTFPENISSRARYRCPILFSLLAVLDWKIFSSTNSPENLFLLTAIFFLSLMTITDFEQYMLFDAMTIPFAIVGAVYVWQMHLNFLNHAAAAIIGGGIFLLLALLSKGSLGGGDVKLIAALGLWLGFEKLLNVVFAGTISGGLAAILMILANKKNRNSYFAYGPYFALTAIYFLLF